MWALVLGAALLGALGGFVWARRGHPVRSCPSCATSLVALPALPDRGLLRDYDVLACPRCNNHLVHVHAGDWPWAKCPRCEHRSLQPTLTRLPGDIEAPLRIHVDESCALCGHAEAFELPPRPMERGKVIAFPGRRR